MSDPVPVPQRRRPPRAEPLQPDKPGQGDERDDVTGAADPAAQAQREASLDKQRKRSEDALDNVRSGYK